MLGADGKLATGKANMNGIAFHDFPGKDFLGNGVFKQVLYCSFKRTRAKLFVVSFLCDLINGLVLYLDLDISLRKPICEFTEPQFSNIADHGFIEAIENNDLIDAI